jgi:hypothetical protein
MKRLHYALMTLGVLVMAAGCETPTSNSQEHAGDATAHNRDLMLGKGAVDVESQAMAGPTADGVIENYHHNQDVTQQTELLKNTGLVKLDD